MSAEEAKEQGYALIPTWWPVATVIVTAIFTLGAAYATVNGKDARQDERLGSLEHRVDQVEEINTRLARIEGALGIPKETHK